MNLIALIKERAKHHRCLACSKALADCGVTLLAESQGHCTVEVTCASCGVSFIAVLLLRPRAHPDGMPSGITEPITGDDLLDVYQQLKHHRGPLTELLSPRPVS
ncbi:MAG TPA: hypothetical protein VET65_10250 [Candidatus Limnocylindrales bacterium]|nr:hypothetical protein [Candidatus Limnocylindrales bacterium]